ncbi:MAG: hypothetical protein U0350_06025 [Caldilineaceae bacterium]
MTIQATIEAVGRAASWDNPALTTWQDLDRTLDMELMRKKSQWSNLGKSDEQLINEILAERGQVQR